MVENLSRWQRAGRRSGLPLLAAVAVAAAAAAWVWPIGKGHVAPFHPESSADVSPSAVPSAAPEAARRDPLAAPAPAEPTAGGSASRRGAIELAREPLRDAVARRGEREHYERFLALAAQAPSALEAEAERVLRGPGPDCEKVALLRALRASGSPQLGAWLEVAIHALPDDSDAAADSAPSYALDQLVEAAAQDAQARIALERVAFGPRRAPDRLRRVAASWLAASASESDLWRLAQDMSAEDDALMRASVLEALSRNRDPSAVAAVFGHVQDEQSPGSSQPPRE